jgi:hypothetical protein
LSPSVIVHEEPTSPIIGHVGVTNLLFSFMQYLVDYNLACQLLVAKALLHGFVVYIFMGL